jgi:PAS domain S-box-containing protein
MKREQVQPSVLWSLRLRTLLLVLLAIVPALLLMAWSARQQRRAAAEQMRTSTLRMSRLAASDAQGKISGARQFLTALSRLTVVRQRDAAKADAIFKNLLSQFPIYANIGAADVNGVVFGSAVAAKGPVSIADRGYFQNAIRGKRFAVGDYQVGRITHTPTINFACPAFDASGNVQAVVFAALRLDWVSRLSAWQLPDDATLTILDDAGIVLLRYPGSDRWVGRKAPNSVLAQALRRGPEGTMEGDGLDGTERLIAFTPLATGAQRRVYVAVGVPLATVYGNIDSIFARNMAGMGVVAILALVAAWVGGDWFFLRQVKALIHASRRIREGDLSARTGSRYGRDELSQLTLAFDEMADSLEELTGRQELILSSAGEGICGVDTNGIIGFANPAAARMLGYTIEEMSGRPSHEILGHSNRDGVPFDPAACPLCAAYLQGTPYRSDDETFHRKDGQPVPVDYVATPAREHGVVQGAVIVFKDITTRKEYEREMAKAHQEVLEAALEKKHFYREVIRSVTQDKLHLVDRGDIHDEGRLLTSGSLNTPDEDRAARRSIRNAACEAGMSIEDAQQLMLAVGEASTNAVKHATEGSYAIFATDDCIVVRVCDHGAGISTENLPATLLQRGFSTKVSLGMGYTLMLELVDRVQLTTDPQGTIIQLEKYIRPADRPASPLAMAMERFATKAA